MIKHKPWFWRAIKAALQRKGEFIDTGYVVCDLRFVTNKVVK